MEGREDVAQGIPARIPRRGNRPEQSLSTFPGILQSCNNKKEGGRKGGRGWDRDTIAGARFGVTTVYLVLILSRGGSCAGMGRGGCCCRQQFRSKHLSRGHATLFLGAELSGARVCHRQSPGTEAELTTGGEGDLLRAKKEKESKFPSSVVSGEEGGRRRGRGEAEATNDRDPAATSKLFGFRRRGPHSKHTRFRLTGSAESSAGQEWSAGSSRGRKAVRGRGTESHRPPGQQEGRSDSRVSGQIGVWEVPPFPKVKKGVKPENVCGGEEGNPSAATRRSALCSYSPLADLAPAAAGPSRGGWVPWAERAWRCVSSWGCASVSESAGLQEAAKGCSSRRTQGKACVAPGMSTGAGH